MAKVSKPQMPVQPMQKTAAKKNPKAKAGKAPVQPNPKTTKSPGGGGIGGSLKGFKPTGGA